MARINEGYEIIASVRTDDNYEIVIGHAINPKRPAQYVCWNCSNGEHYSVGQYCTTYRCALYVMSERITAGYDSIKLEAPTRDPGTERAKLLVPLISRQCYDEDEPSFRAIDAAQGLAADLYKDLGYEYDKLIQWFDAHGWTEKDRNYFGISQMFDESEEE